MMTDQQTPRRFWRRHPLVCAAVVALAGWLLSDGHYLTVGLAAALALMVTIRRRRRANALRDAGLRARADYEHQLNAAGDPRGTFGRYPPVQPGWFPDPADRRRMRYFDGVAWTRHAARG